MTEAPAAALPDHEMRAPTLHSATFERGPMAESGLLDYVVRSDALVWGRRGDGKVGFGAVARCDARGTDRFATARAWWADVSRRATAAPGQEPTAPGAGVVAFATFAFDATSAAASTLIVPRLVVGRSADSSWLTIISDDPSEELTLERAEEELALALDEVDDEAELHRGGTLAAGHVSEDAFMASVAAGVAAIDAGELTKLVLARDAVAELDGPVAVAQVLRELALRYSDCWTYSVDGLIGATPEMLVRVDGATAQARVLAGTLDRSTAPADDPHYPHRVLAGDEKQRHEHQLAIDSLTAELGPLVSEMIAPAEPFVLQLPNVWHLASDVQAHLTPYDDGRTPSALDLAEVLHPTAAVCGTPTEAAAGLIRRLEGMDRGRYAGPVGWVDADGNGEFGIALRGGVIESTSCIRLYAGCGIVAASDPAAELAESWAKMRPMREALNL